MSTGDELIARLSDFGLREKEARLYLHLLKYGARPPAVIERATHTYRRDVHRTLNYLIDKGIVAKSISKPTVYVAVPLTNALDVLVMRQKLQQHELETRKQELVELAESTAMEDAMSESTETSESIEGCTYKMLRGPKEIDAVSTQFILEATSDISALMPGSILTVFNKTGLLDATPDLVRRGMRLRLITNISRDNLQSARYALEQGAELRHIETSQSMQFTVFDKRKSLVLIRFDPERSPLRDASITFFLCESPTYARHLMYHYELEWGRAVDGLARIAELTQNG